MYPAVTATALIPRARHASATSIAYSRKMTGSLYVNATLAQPRASAASAIASGDAAAGGAEREHRAAGKEVVERLLLDRVDAEAARAAVRRQHDLVALAHADEAQAALALPELARARADV